MSDLLNLVSVVGGLYGAKRLSDAAADNNKAQRINARAAELVTAYDELLSQATAHTEGVLRDFKRLQQAAWERQLRRLSTALARVEFAGGAPLGDLGALPPTPASALQALVPYQGGALESGGTAVVAAGATALAIYGFVGAVGTASTGTPIGRLSGVARRNATLASLGGGTRKDGGGGTDGGAVTLSLAAIGAGLFVGGELAAAKASGNLATAQANLARAEQHVEETKLTLTVLSGIDEMVDRLTTDIGEIEQRLTPMIEQVEEIIRCEGTTYAAYSTEQLQVIHRAIGGALLLKERLELQVVTPGGATLSDECALLAGKAEQQLPELGITP